MFKVNMLNFPGTFKVKNEMTLSCHFDHLVCYDLWPGDDTDTQFHLQTRGALRQKNK